MMGSDEEVGGAFSRSLGIPLAACTYRADTHQTTRKDSLSVRGLGWSMVEKGCGRYTCGRVTVKNRHMDFPFKLFDC